MDNYLLDYETLGKFVDEIMKTSPMPASSTEELNALRETNIKKLDDKIATAIFSSLNDEQLEQINTILDNDDGNSEAYEAFFKEAGVDIEQVITKAVQDFSAEITGGQNA